MKRSFLEGLGLEKEKIDKILDEYGKDLEKTKTELTAQRDDYKKQLEKAQDTLKSFEGVDVAKLQDEIKTLEENIKTAKSDADKRIAELNFTHLLENQATEAGAKNIKAVTALLDVDTLKGSKNQEADIKAALEAVKKDADYLFSSDDKTPTEPFNNPVGGTNPPPQNKTVEDLSKMSYDEYKAYRNSK